MAASFALLGDVNIAEPKALIGFAGPRVVESTIRQKLPEGFQRSEFLLAHGMIDRIVSRLDMKRTLAQLVTHLLPRTPHAHARAQPGVTRAEHASSDAADANRRTADPAAKPPERP